MIFHPNTTPAQHRAAAEAGRASMNGTATMTDKPHMTLLNGDKLFEGDYGRTLDGRKVGPVLMRNLRDDYDGAFRWRVGEDTYTDGGSFFLAFQSDNDIIAKWAEAAREFAAPRANTDPINHFQMFMDRQAAKGRARIPADPEAMGRALAAEAAGCPFALGELLDRVTAAARAAQARAHEGVV